MSNSTMENEFPDDEQRYAVCQRQWNEGSKGGDEMQYKTKKVPFELKEFDEETGVFEGYAAVFGNVDDGNDLIEKGAFKKTLQENAHRVKICWQHDFKKPIGKPLEMREDSHGLFVKGKISKTSLGEDVITLLKDKVIDELSIGYNAVKKEWKNGVRHLRECRLFEFSPVTMAMNSQALITNVKSLEDRFNIKQDVMTEMEGQELQEQKWDIENAFNEVIYDLLNDEEMNSQEKLDSFNQSLEQYNNLMTAWFEAMLELGVKSFDKYMQIKGVVEFQDLPLANREKEWDGDAAEQRLREFASSDNSGDKDTINWDVYRQGWLWYEEEAEENFTSYKFNIADIVDGEMVAVPQGIFTAAAILQGAMLEEGATQINVPRNDIEGMKEHLTRYYAKMREEFDDDELIAPWNEAAKSSNEQLLYSVIGMSNFNSKEGRVLSATNRQLVKNAVEALQSLLEATEPDNKSTHSSEAGGKEDEPDDKSSTHEDKDDITVDDILEDLTAISNTLSKK